MIWNFFRPDDPRGVREQLALAAKTPPYFSVTPHDTLFHELSRALLRPALAARMREDGGDRLALRVKKTHSITSEIAVKTIQKALDVSVRKHASEVGRNAAYEHPADAVRYAECIDESQLDDALQTLELRLGRAQRPKPLPLNPHPLEQIFIALARASWPMPGDYLFINVDS